MPNYKRSQVEDSLWATFRLGAAAQRVPHIFNVRIKKLLDLDRTVPDGTLDVPPVFNDSRAGGHGVDVPFTSFHAFMLGLGLELWNARLKQSDVIFFLRHTRDRLELWHRRILAQPTLPAAQLDLPTRRVNGIETPDRSIFMVLGGIGFNETILTASQAEAEEKPIFFEPRFYPGVEGLAVFFAEAPLARRTNLVIELTELALTINQHLLHTPARRRGRPS